jgi:hypothetical protein
LHLNQAIFVHINGCDQIIQQGFLGDQTSVPELSSCEWIKRYIRI